jgi:acetyltransferase-like isoleucine patch superfamily enzyme
MFYQVSRLFKKTIGYFHKKNWKRHTKSDCFLGDITDYGFNKKIIENIHAGKFSYGGINFRSFSTDGEGLEIGCYCSIAENVYFMLGGNHEYDVVSTYHLANKQSKVNDAKTKGRIIVKDDVWIGFGALILSGVTLGQGSIVGAMSVVTKDVPPYAIVCGNPAKIVKFRFDNYIVSKLSSINLSSIDLTKTDIIKSYVKLTDSNVDNVIDYLKMFSSKKD